jgi:hypothetical protein
MHQWAFVDLWMNILWQKRDSKYLESNSLKTAVNHNGHKGQPQSRGQNLLLWFLVLTLTGSQRCSIEKASRELRTMAIQNQYLYQYSWTSVTGWTSDWSGMPNPSKSKKVFVKITKHKKLFFKLLFAYNRKVSHKKLKTKAFRRKLRVFIILTGDNSTKY